MERIYGFAILTALRDPAHHTVMTAKQALAEKLLQDLRGTGDALTPKREEWVGDLQALMQQFQAWLGGPEFRDTLLVTEEPLELVEEDLGAYTVPSLRVQSQTRHPREVHVKPRAMQVVGGIAFSGHGSQRRIVQGAAGRVDLVSGAARQTLLRFVQDDGTSWRWLHRDGELTEDSFFAVLSELFA